MTKTKTVEPVAETNSLALISAAHRALAEAVTLSDFRTIRDNAEALRVYAQVHGLGIANENLAAEIKFRAERGGGLRLQAMDDAGELRTQRDGTTFRHPAPDAEVPATLAEVGLTAQRASEWRVFTRLTDEQFEAVMERAKSLRPDGSVRRIARIEFAEEVELLYPREGPAPRKAQPERRTGTMAPELHVMGQEPMPWARPVDGHYDRDTDRYVSDVAAGEPDLPGIINATPADTKALGLWDDVVAAMDTLQDFIDHGWLPSRASVTLHAEVNAVGKTLLALQRLAGPVA